MDLDDLLEDVIDTKKKGAPIKKSTTTMKKAPIEDDGWGLGDLGDSTEFKPKKTFGFGGADGLKKEVKKKNEDDEWALDLDTKPTVNRQGFGGLLGRKPKKDDADDLLDDVLDGLEADRGVESTKAADKPTINL